MNATTALMPLMVCGIATATLAADRYHERKAQMLHSTESYNYAENNKRTIMVTVTNPQYSLFQRIAIQYNGHATYETLASIISSRLLVDGELVIRRDERNFKDVSTSHAQYNATDNLYFISRGEMGSSFELAD